MFKALLARSAVNELNATLGCPLKALALLRAGVQAPVVAWLQRAPAALKTRLLNRVSGLVAGMGYCWVSCFFFFFFCVTELPSSCV